MDASTHRSVSLAIASVAALGGIIAVIGYFDRKKHEELKGEIMELDKNIKLLDLDHKLHKATA